VQASQNQTRLVVVDESQLAPRPRSEASQRVQGSCVPRGQGRQYPKSPVYLQLENGEVASMSKGARQIGSVLDDLAAACASQQ